MTKYEKTNLGTVLLVEQLPADAISAPLIPIAGVVASIEAAEEPVAFRPLGYATEFVAEPVANGYNIRLTVQVQANDTNRNIAIGWNRRKHLLVAHQPGGVKRILGNDGNGAKCSISFAGGSHTMQPTIAISWQWLSRELPALLSGNLGLLYDYASTTGIIYTSTTGIAFKTTT